MRNRIFRWMMVFFGGGLVLATSVDGCLSEVLRGVGNSLDNVADDMDGSGDLDDFLDDIGDLFD